ncbi:ester cyclase [Salegentibacter sp. JZCK2]|uniref:nuclear transport factor 2 family protein n=1 Tax=Salegentibacter tibetensis TaxID=2873600 RepID=UPI001CCEA097|nr:ester cyclase [Salegentibacter tibetensis]MBZ9728652.1 ester cyclase [Salegentibacter tibetensis]
MKALVSFGLAIAIFIVYNSQDKRYTQQSAEIDTYKKVLEAYEERDWETMVAHYADSAKIMNNVEEKDAQNLSQFLAQNKEDATQFSSWDFVETESEYEMVVNDKGETWVNFWGLWQGTFKANNKEYKIPTHITAHFVNGKIVREAGYWDVSKIIQDIQKDQNDESDSLEKSNRN